MEAKILFTERQRFNQWWLWLLLIGVNCVPIFGFIQELLSEHSFQDAAKNFGLGFMFVFTGGIIALFRFFRLDTQITENGILVRFFPFDIKFQEFRWENIDQVYIRQYKPLSEFGGWGIRYGMDGKAYNVSGSQGIQIVFKNGKKLLIGTNKPEEAAEALKQIQTIAR